MELAPLSDGALLRPASRTLLDKKAARTPIRAAVLLTPEHPLLHVVVEEKLIRMRAQAQGIVLLALGGDPHVQEVQREHVALEQEVMVLLQAIQRLRQTPRHVRNLLQLFGRQLE